MSFGAIADQYNRLRPTSPSQAVDWLLLVGTVVAIEPDTRMGAVLRANSPGVHVVAGLAEALPLADGSVDAVLVSSAWHWMDPERAVPEIGRVLRDGGRFGLIWTRRDREVGWVRDMDALREPAGSNRPALSPRYRNQEIELPEPHSFADLEIASFTFTKTMPIEDFAPMIGTYSRIITASEQERAEIFARVREAIEAEFPGATEIDLPMRSLCWRATRVSRGRSAS